jgi:hypothetical protein
VILDRVRGPGGGRALTEPHALEAHELGGGRVREDQLALRVVDHDSLVQDRHDAVHPPLDALEVREKARVVQGQRDTPGKRLRKANVVQGVAPSRPRGVDGQRAQHAIARQHRDRYRRPQP